MRMRLSLVASKAREAALWVGASLGVVCLVLGALALVFDVRPLVFQSGSMAPEIESGAVALAREVPASELAVGDVVSVIDDRNIRVTHRIVAIEQAGAGAELQLKGDANSGRDAQTYQVDEAYRVFADIPWLGHVVNAAGSTWGLLLCGAFVMFLLMTSFGRRRDDSDFSHRAQPASGQPTKSPVSRSAMGVLALGALFAGSTQLAPLDTMAAFNDNATVTSGSLTALAQVPAPASVTCVQSSGLDKDWSEARWTSNPRVNYTAELWYAPNLGDHTFIRSIPVLNNPQEGASGSPVLTVRMYPADLPQTSRYYKIVVFAHLKGAPTWLSSRVTMDKRFYLWPSLLFTPPYVTCEGL